MKDLNRFIKESLLDDEDDLVDNDAPAALGWLSKNVTEGYGDTPIGDEVYNFFKYNNGIINIITKGRTLTFKDVPPTDSIKKINSGDNNIVIDYPIKSQKDIDMYPSLCCISNQKNLKDITISPCNEGVYPHHILTFDSILKLNDVVIDCGKLTKTFYIRFEGRTPFKKIEDLLQLSTINNKQIKIVISFTGILASNLSKELKDKSIGDPTSYLNKHYGDILNQIRKNTGCSEILLGTTIRACSFKYSDKVDKWLYDW